MSRKEGSQPHSVFPSQETDTLQAYLRLSKMMPGDCMINMLAGSSAFSATHEDRHGRAQAGQRTEVPLLQ